MINYNLYISLYAFLFLLMLGVSLMAGKIKIKVLHMKKKRVDFIFIIFIALMISLIACMRPLESPDTLGYYAVYKLDFFSTDYNMFHYGLRYNNMEVLFVILMGALKQLYMSFRAELFFFSFLNCMLFIYGSIWIAEEYLKSEIKLNYMLVFFFALFGMHYCCIAIRAGLSIGLSLAATGFFLKGKKIMGIISIVLACLFHSASIISLIPILIMIFDHSSRSYKKLVWFVSMFSLSSLALNLGGIFINSIIKGIRIVATRFHISGFSTYLNTIDARVGKRQWLMVIGVIVLLLIVMKQIANENKLPVIVLIGLMVMAVMYPMNASNRLTDYFFVYIIPLVGTLEVSRKDTIESLYIKLGMPVLCFVFMMTL